MSVSKTKTTLLGCALAASSIAQADGVQAFFTEGEFGLGIRARYEFADIDNGFFEEAHALTVKTNLSYKFGEVSGLSGFVDIADVTAVDDSSFNAAGLNGEGGKSVIADPETTEVKQAYLSYSADGGLLKLGRQRIIYDNSRHIGNVGWRQDEQTYDAVSGQYSASGFTAKYAYIWDVNRIFAEARDWESDTHLFNLTYTGFEGIKIGAYAYLYDLNEGAIDNDTYGLFVSGKLPLDSATIGYYAEYANQDSDTTESDYYHVMADVTVAGYTFGAGYEVLGAGDNGGGFATPLGTAHKFNGWADHVLPIAGLAGGLEDFYFVFKTKIADKVPFTAKYHFFDSDEGNSLEGQEFNASAAYKFNENFTGLLKGAIYDGDNRADVTRFWAQLQFTY